MSKYNILRDDESQEEKKEPVDKKQLQKDPVSNDEAIFESPQVPPVSETKQTPGEEYFSDELFPVGEEPEAENVFEEKADPEESSQRLEKSEDQSYVVSPVSEPEAPLTNEETAESEYPLAEKKAGSQPLFAYEQDDKQEGMNYKPIFIGGGIVVAVIAIFFIVSNLFFGEGEEKPAEQKVESAEEKLKSEQEERKQNFLADINRNTSHNLKSIYLLASLDQPKVKYSSILLFGNSLDLEVFVPDRGVLAKYNLKVKDDQNIENYTIETVDQRPGSKGGLFALYDINLKKMAVSSSRASSSPVRVTPDNWQETVVQKSGMTVNSQRTISSRQENLFRVSRIEYDLRGSIQNSLSLINQLANTNLNIAVHKLILLPTDQRNMSTSSYMLKLIIDFYL